MTLDPKRIRYLRSPASSSSPWSPSLLWPSARLVDSGQAERGPVRETVDAEGRTRLRDRYVIAAPIAAMARRLQLEPGDAIEAGQVLVVLDPVTAPTLDTRSRAEAVARLAAARARYAAAREETRAAEASASTCAPSGAPRELLSGSSSPPWTPSPRPPQRCAPIARRRARSSARPRPGTRSTAAEVVLARGSRDEAGDAALELAAPVCRRRAAPALRERAAGTGRRAAARDRRSRRASRSRSMCCPPMPCGCARACASS